ncbi:sigma-70 family RNA polymerase sigma factor [Acetobacteraceae bacterium H6797]|nr:sigma-70 family RNA polymerase sigma factor [Acetobacteraceae bacterium H6797]
MSCGTDSDSALIVAIAQRRDRQAFAALFRAYAPRLKAWLRRAGTDAAQAEEIAQEAMLTVWRKAELYDPARAQPAAWIFTIARNQRIDALRRSRLALPEPEEGDDAPLADAMLVAEEQALRLRAAMAALPPEQAEALRLAYFEEFTHSRLETALGVPLGTVKSRLRLALTRLRAALKDQD